MFMVCADVTTDVRTTRPQMQTATKLFLHFSTSISAFNKNLLAEWSNIAQSKCAQLFFVVVVVISVSNSFRTHGAMLKQAFLSFDKIAASIIITNVFFSW